MGKNMEILRLFTENRVFLRAASAWAAAQVIKMINNFIMTEDLSIERLFGSGGMPSSHSAFVTAMATSAVRVCGYSSPVSAVAICLAFIVMYDAMGVRRQAGEHAKVLNDLVECLQKDNIVADDLRHNFKELLGHTPLQVAAGFVLGLLMGCLVN